MTLKNNINFSVIIPAAIKSILHDNPNLELRCAHCSCICEDATKFICLGLSAADIVKYLKDNPNFAERAMKQYEKELSEIDDEISFDFTQFSH